MRAEGIDVSRWQRDNVDWEQMRARGISFAFIRASHGLKADEYYPINCIRAREAGILRGAYHYLYPDWGPRDQARVFAHVMGDVELGGALDVEQNYITERHVRAFLDEFYLISGKRPIIYTSESKWYLLVGRSKTWAEQYPLWVAHWDVENPTLPEPWDHWEFHQYSDSAGLLDLNRYNGSEQMLRARYG